MAHMGPPPVMSPRRTAQLTRLVETSMADHFERMYPDEGSPTELFYKLLKHKPRGSEKWDTEDAALFAGDMHSWLSTASFNATTHPRLFAASAMAGMYVLVTSLEPVRSPVNGLPSGAHMKVSLWPRQTPENCNQFRSGQVHDVGGKVQ